jgi:hypothetical protein
VENRFTKASPFSAAVLGREFFGPRLLFVVLVPLFDFTAYGKNSARDGWWGLFPIAASAESPTTKS